MAEPAAAHLRRDAYIYVRQSTLVQTVRNTESLLRQYDLAGRARQLGWAEHQIVVVDDDLGRSGASAQGRKGFSDLVADVGLGKAGIVLSLESSRLARNNALFRYRNKAFCSACRFMPRRKPKPWRRMEGAGVEAE
jgi:DNA invertase Pin-like site-specific DNA recombinase